MLGLCGHFRFVELGDVVLFILGEALCTCGIAALMVTDSSEDSVSLISRAKHALVEKGWVWVLWVAVLVGFFIVCWSGSILFPLIL